MFIAFCDECAKGVGQEIIESDGGYIETCDIHKDNTHLVNLTEAKEQLRIAGWHYVTLESSKYLFCPDCYKLYCDDKAYYENRELLKEHLDNPDLGVWKSGLGLYLISYDKTDNKFDAELSGWSLLDSERTTKGWDETLFDRIKRAIAYLLPFCKFWHLWGQFEPEIIERMEKFAQEFLNQPVEFPREKMGE